MERLVHAISASLAALAVVAFIFIMISISTDVLFRAATGRSLGPIVEYNEVALVTFVFGGLAQAHRYRAHVGTSFVMQRIPRKMGTVLAIVGLAVALIAIAWMTWATGIVAIDSFARGEYRFGVSRVPVWPARIVVSVGLLALVLEILLSFRDVPRRSISDEGGGV